MGIQQQEDRVLIIAEAGVNHNGDIEKAIELINVAKQAGADIVKFQTFKSKNIVSKAAKLADYQKRNLGTETSQLEMLRKLELSPAHHQILLDHCKHLDIEFLTTAFDLESFDFIDKLPLNYHKIPSGEITNLPYLVRVAGSNKKVILSTGMSTLEEVEAALDILLENGCQLKNITVLHCNTEYPTPFEDVNLKAMLTIRDQFRVRVGYSDHTQGIEVPIAAVAMGAKIIEKHYTLDKTMEGPDHKASLEPNELKAMVDAIRHIESALGDGIKQPSKSEQKNIAIARKSIFSVRALNKGEVLTAEMLIMKRPGTGISPMRINELIGRKLLRNVEEDTLIQPEDLEKA